MADIDRDALARVIASTPGSSLAVADAVIDHLRTTAPSVDIEQACKIMHDAYEAAAAQTGWETQKASRTHWAEVPEANKATMRVAVTALLDHLRAAAHPATAGDEQAKARYRVTTTPDGGPFYPALLTASDDLDYLHWAAQKWAGRVGMGHPERVAAAWERLASAALAAHPATAGDECGAWGGCPLPHAAPPAPAADGALRGRIEALCADAYRAPDNRGWVKARTLRAALAATPAEPGDRPLRSTWALREARIDAASASLANTPFGIDRYPFSPSDYRTDLGAAIDAALAVPPADQPSREGDRG